VFSRSAKMQMKFRIRHSEGHGESDPSVSKLPELYDELYSATPEHGDVAVTNVELGWRISAHRGGTVILAQSGKQGSARHMAPVSKDKVLQLWGMLIEGQIDRVLTEPWKSGYQ